MKTLELFTGGHKFHNEDFEYLRDGQTGVLDNIVKSLKQTADTFVILGEPTITSTTSSTTWTQMEVWYAGNFYTLPAAANIDLAASSFDLTDVPDVNNPVSYKDGASRDVHITKTLVLRNDNGGVVQATEIIEENKLIYFLDNKIVDTGWTNEGIDLSFGDPAWTELKPVQYKRTGNKMEWRGVIRSPITSTPSRINLFTQNVANAPLYSVIRQQELSPATGALRLECRLFFDFIGDVYIDNTSFDITNADLPLDGIVYYI